jgi:dTDP-4-dehydrorhamnose 3,5-epimerase
VIFHPAALPGAQVIELDENRDPRGSFARIWCEREFATHGLPSRMVQASLSVTARAGTVRGMHFQAAPSREGKLVRCVRGAVFDVIIDLRPDSPTFKQQLAIELSAANRKAVYVPPGFAHGFQTLVDDVELLYFMSDFYAPEAGRGLRWNDPAFAIPWPLPVTAIADRDRDYPDVDPGELEGFRKYFS